MANSPIMHSRQRNNTEEEGLALLGEVVDNVDRNATLTATPRSLHLLWTEYMHGVGGRKAARLFTPAERGKVKHKYSLRKTFWDLVKVMVNQGYTSSSAIDKVYEKYGHLGSVTKMLRGIRRDRNSNDLQNSFVFDSV